MYMTRDEYDHHKRMIRHEVFSILGDRARLQEAIDILRGPGHTNRIGRAVEILEAVVALSRPQRESPL